MKKTIFILCAFLAIVVMVSCKGEKQTPVTTEADYSKIERPSFNSDSAFVFIEKQLAFGARVPGTKAHELCAEYMISTLKEYADTVFVQSFSRKIFNGKQMQGKNIIASFSKEKQNRIFLAAHWDSRMFADQDPDEKKHKTPVMGANDGASGVGVLMEIARLLKSQKPDVGVDIILFDLEDQGCPEGELNTLPSGTDWCIGSQYWAENKHTPYYQAQYGVLLDMVGWGKPRFAMEEVSMHYASGIMEKVWNVAKKLGYGYAFIDEKTPPIIDDHLFINRIANIPTIDIVQNSVEGNFFPYWHTVKDDINVIDKNTLHMVGDVVLTVLFSE